MHIFPGINVPVLTVCIIIIIILPNTYRKNDCIFQYITNVTPASSKIWKILGHTNLTALIFSEGIWSALHQTIITIHI